MIIIWLRQSHADKLMDISLIQVIDNRGRLLLVKDNEFVLDQRVHPKFNPNHIFQKSYNADNHLLTEDGKIYDLNLQLTLDVDYIIARFFKVLNSMFVAVTIDGILLRIDVDINEANIQVVAVIEIAVDIRCLLNYSAYPSENAAEVLVMDYEDRWKLIRSNGHIIRRYNDHRLPGVAQINRIKKDVILTSKSLIWLNSGEEYKIVDIEHLGINPVNVVELFWCVDYQPSRLAVLLDDKGDLYYDSSQFGDGPYIPCHNRILADYNSKCKWIKLVHMFADNCIGIINEKGEVYKISDRLFLNTTDIPIEIFG